MIAAKTNAARLASEIANSNSPIDHLTAVGVTVVATEPERAWSAGYLSSQIAELLDEPLPMLLMVEVERKLRQLKLVKNAHNPKRFKLSPFGAEVVTLLLVEDAEVESE